MVEERPAIATGRVHRHEGILRTTSRPPSSNSGRRRTHPRPSLLDKAEQELKRQYFNRGLYSVEVHARMSPLERNRTAITFEVRRARSSKIRAINIVGARPSRKRNCSSNSS
jgi:hypothetical protein